MSAASFHRTSRLRLAREAAILLAATLALAWLAQRAGRSLAYDWDWSVLPQFLAFHDPDSGSWRAGRILTGLFTTIRLSLWAGALALLLGTLAGLMRGSNRLFWRLVGGSYVLSVRNAPPLVLIFLFSFFLGTPLMIALGLDARLAALPESLRPLLEALLGPVGQLPAFLAAVVTLGLIEGAYMAEIVRAGVASVEPGQWDAAHALGLTRAGALRHVILPQAFRRMLPPLTGQFVSTVKDSAIVSVISIPELAFQAQELVSATYRSFEVWTLTLVLYLALTLPCSLSARWLELRLTRSDRDGQEGRD